ncbi:MAG: ABC transporter, ATP-binding protein, possible subtilin transporter [candidate division WS6 bacterium GW2011_GWF2_39_15]|uniref:ABC transporter, ATP-binding protein, possible subtilin transporter n=1 Tax=candidate division WS6 bacterium GW2011_GWF2_39_15 TaxID=1619100 RepID=A0A0G0MYD4_9BACT|nr:MAG: ABC transporter, ATP-binding protein, possible subtilin transporter [candidate division WS6 bacterium GW2011_GWF2_39_15]
MQITKKVKLGVLFKILKLVYGLFPLQAITRDFVFIIVIALEMYGIKVGGQFIDATARLLIDHFEFTFASYFITDSFFYLTLGLGIWMLISALNSLRNFLYESIFKKVQFHMQSALLEGIARANLEDVERKEFRDLLEFVPKFSYENILATYQGFSDGIKWFIRGVAAMFILFSSLGLPALLLIVFVLPENLAGHLNRKKRHDYNNSEVERMKKVSYFDNLITRLPFFPELRVDNSVRYLKERYEKDGGAVMNGFIELLKHYYIDTTLFNIIGRLLLTGFIIFILVISLILKFSIGSFKALYDYTVTAYESFLEFVGTILRVSTYLDYAEKYFEYIEYKGFGDVIHGEGLLNAETPDLELKDLSYIYLDSGRKALNDVNLKVEAGKHVAIIGSDGSGKSSLVRILCGLYRIVDGNYMIGGISIKDLARGELKKKVSVVFQEFVNYNLSLKENITLTSDRKRINRMLYDKALSISGVDKMMEKEGILEHQVLGKYFSGGREISPGYWQRLAIARAIYRDRDVYILDEPFLHIDEESRGKILQSLLSYIGNLHSLIYITQEEDFLDLFDDVYDLKNGKLVKRSK